MSDDEKAKLTEAAAIETAEKAQANRSLAAPTGSASAIPMVLFDGYAVWLEMTKEEKARTQMHNVSDVLDAVVRLMRRSRKPNEKGQP